MSSRSWLIPLALVLFISPAKALFAQQNPTVTTQPKLAMARIDDEGQFVVKTLIDKPVFSEETRTGTVTKYRPETRMRKQKVTRDGQTVEEDVTYTVQVPYLETVEFTVKVLRLVSEENETAYPQDPKTKGYQTAFGQALAFFETNGEKVSSAEVGERLKDWHVILVTLSGQPAEDYYAYLFKPGTLVAALPRPLESPSAAPQNPPEKPRGQEPLSVPPTFAFARMEGDRLSLRTIIEEAETQRLLAKPKEGENKPASVDVESLTRTHYVWRMGPDAVEAMTAGGQKINGETLASRLPKETTVLILRENRPIDVEWLKNLRPETLVISTPLSDTAGTLYDRDAPRMPRPFAPSVGPGDSAPPAAPANEPPRPREALEPSSQEKKTEDDLSFLSKAERDVFERTNQERAKAGKPPLKASPELSKAARAHAENMAKKQMLSHTLDGMTFDQRIEATGYRFSGAGENISSAPTAEISIGSWLKSPGHRQNMLNEAYKEIGIGQGVSSTGENYWVQVFATPFPAQ